MAASDFDDDDSDESHSSLFFKFIDVMSTNDDISDHHTRYWWIEEIENAKLAKELRNLSDEYLELITLLCMEGCTQIEAAAKMGMTYRTLKRRVAALRKKLEEFL